MRGDCHFFMPIVFYPSNGQRGTEMLLCIGAPLVIAGIIWGAINFVFLLRAKETTGSIVGETSFRSNRSGTSYRHIVKFQGPDGKTVQFTERLGSSADSGFIIGVSKLIYSLVRGKSLEDAGEDARTSRGFNTCFWSQPS